MNAQPIVESAQKMSETVTLESWQFGLLIAAGAWVLGNGIRLGVLWVINRFKNQDEKIETYGDKLDKIHFVLSDIQMELRERPTLEKVGDVVDKKIDHHQKHCHVVQEGKLADATA